MLELSGGRYLNLNLTEKYWFAKKNKQWISCRIWEVLNRIQYTMRKRPTIILELNCFVEVPLCFVWVLLQPYLLKEALYSSQSSCRPGGNAVAWCHGLTQLVTHTTQPFTHHPFVPLGGNQDTWCSLAVCWVKTVQISWILTAVYSEVKLNRTKQKMPCRWKQMWYLLRGSLRAADYTAFRSNIWE